MTTRKSGQSAARRYRVYIIAVILGAITSGAALLLFSFIVFSLKLPVSYSGFFSLLSFGVGCLTSGFFAGASKRQGGLAAGIRAALLFLLPIALISWFVGGFTGEAALNKIIIAILCGGAGGVIGVNRNSGF